MTRSLYHLIFFVRVFRASSKFPYQYSRLTLLCRKGRKGATSLWFEFSHHEWDTRILLHLEPFEYNKKPDGQGTSGRRRFISISTTQGNDVIARVADRIVDAVDKPSVHRFILYSLDLLILFFLLVHCLIARWKGFPVRIKGLGRSLPPLFLKMNDYMYLNKNFVHSNDFKNKCISNVRSVIQGNFYFSLTRSCFFLFPTFPQHKTVVR